MLRVQAFKSGLRRSARAVRRQDREDRRRRIPGDTERLSHGVGDAADVVVGCQSDCSTAEPATGHPGAHRPVFPRSFNGKVKLGAGDLEVVPHRGVAGVEQVTEGARPLILEDLHRVLDPRILGDHVADPSEGLLVDGAGGLGQVSYPEVTQRAHSHQVRTAFAGCTALGITAGRVRVANAGIDHQDGQAGTLQRQGDEARFEAAAVQEHRVPGPAQQRRRLVHHPGGGARHVVLGALAHRRQPGGGDAKTSQVVDRHRHRALKRSGGGQAGTDRHLRGDQQVHTREPVPQLLQGPEHAQRVG